MKILIVSQYFWPEGFIVNNLAVELKKRGHEVVVLTGLPNYPKGSFFDGYSFFKGPWSEDYHGVSVIRVPLLARGKGFFRLALNYISFVLFGIFPGMFRVPKDVDVVFCFGLSPVTLCLPAVVYKKIFKKPLLFWVQDLWPESILAVGATKSAFVIRAVGALVRYIYSKCDLILMQSKAFEGSILKWGGRKELLRYVPNWFQRPTDSVLPRSQWLNDLPEGFKIVFAGNIGKAQDMPTIMKAADILKNHKDIHWIIVGDGSEKAYVDAEIEKLGLINQVHTYGRRPVDDMPDLFSRCDVMLVSLADEYIFSLTIPSKVQAYMASKKPILAALNGEGARVVLEAGAGLACPSESPEKMAEGILQFKEMAGQEREQMGLNGYRYFEKYFEEQLVISEIENLCREAVENAMEQS